MPIRIKYCKQSIDTVNSSKIMIFSVKIINRKNNFFQYIKWVNYNKWFDLIWRICYFIKKL